MEERRKDVVSTVMPITIEKEQLSKIFQEKEIHKKFMKTMASHTIMRALAECMEKAEKITNASSKEVYNTILEALQVLILKDAFQLLVEENITRDQAILKIISEDFIKRVLLEEILVSFEISSQISGALEEILKDWIDFEDFLSNEDNEDQSE